MAMDWNALLRELDWENPERQAQDLRQRLRQRAEQYATPRADASASGQQDALHLRFQLGNERYAVDVMHVRGVRTLTRVTRVPGTPPFYRGVINVRGQIVTVLDLRYLLDTPARTQPHELVLVAAQDLALALLADRVTDVWALPQATIEPMEMQYARGITPDETVVLDLDRLLRDERLIIRKEF